MTPEQILAIPPKVLTQAQREFYFNEGYLLVERAIDEAWLTCLRAATDELVERSRAITHTDAVFDLEPRHSADTPRLRRVSNPVEQHPAYWDYCLNSVMPDIVADLVGPDVKFHHSKLNFKWAQGGEEVKWHYDISFWPHTNYSPLTVGTYLHDRGMGQGPLAVLPRSHLIDPMLSQYDAQGQWTGCLSEADCAKLDLTKAVYMPGPAGSLTIHNCRTLHYSARNESDLGRRLPLHRQPDPAKARPGPAARPACALRPPRPAALFDAARLVQGLHLDLRAAAARGRSGGGALKPCRPRNRCRPNSCRPCSRSGWQARSRCTVNP